MADQKLPGYGNLINRTLQTLTEKPVELLTTSLVPVVPYAILTMLFGSQLLKQGSMVGTNIPAMVGFTGLMAIVSTLSYLWQYLSLINYTSSQVSSTPINAKQALLLSWRKFGSLLKTQIPLTLSTIGVFILFLIPGIVLAVGLSQTEVTKSLIGLPFLGLFFLLAIPGIILSLWFSQAPWVAIAEGISGRPALAKSKAYVQGRGFSVFLRVLGTLIFAIPFSFISGILGIVPVVGAGLSVLLSAVVTCLTIVYLTHVYNDLRTTRVNPEVKPTPWYVNAAMVFGALAIVGAFAASFLVAMINPLAKIQQAQTQYERMYPTDTTTNPDMNTDSTVPAAQEDMAYIFLNALSQGLQSNAAPVATTFSWNDPKTSTSKQLQGYSLDISSMRPQDIETGLNAAKFELVNTSTTSEGKNMSYELGGLVCHLLDATNGNHTLTCGVLQ